MRVNRFYQQNIHYVTALLAIALLLQAFIPRGFMPDFESDDSFAMSICRASDVGKTPSPYAPENTPEHAQDTGCAFMVVGHSDGAVSAYNIAAPVFYAAQDPWQNAAATMQSPRKYWQSQAPPEFS
jgi:hypothetical protein